MEQKLKFRGNFGLVLGSGGARGLAHYGVIRALKEKRLSPNIIVGTSMGAILGAVAATGSIPALEHLLLDLDFITTARAFLDPSYDRGGLLKGERAIRFISLFLPDCLIEDIPIPFAALATDLSTGKPVIINRGRLFDAIRASISIPGVFTPVHCNGTELVDGGISSPVPIETAREMGADWIMAVNVDNSFPCPYRESLLPPSVDKALETSKRLLEETREKIDARLPKKSKRKSKTKQPRRNIVEVLYKTARICEDRIAANEICEHKPEVLIEPAVGDIPTLDFMRYRDAIRAGYDSAKSILPSIFEDKEHL